MKLNEYYQQLYAYHAWANQKVLASAAQLTEDQFRQPQVHSWGSVYGVLWHMMNAEWTWMQRLKGHSPSAFLPQEDYPTLAALEEAWGKLADEFQTFLAQQTEESLEREVSYSTTKGTPRKLCVWQILAHLANHGTHHRGELAAMFAVMGVTHEEEDMNQYFLR